MIAQNPITHDGVTYDRLTISLAVSQRYTPNGDSQTSVALRGVPTAVTEEGVKTLDDEAKSIYRGSLSEISSGDEQECVDAMRGVLIAFLRSQGW